jgi:catalase
MGNWDLVRDNIPVVVIQRAVKFPDPTHAAKMQADRGSPRRRPRAKHTGISSVSAPVDASTKKGAPLEAERP